MDPVHDSTGKRTTIYDLATQAGASPSAISAILNGTWKKRRISETLAQKVLQLAKERGYARNMQASALRRDRSHLIGMIVPKYDNHYFGSIVEKFEMMARDIGLFPIITCTRRDPALEIEAAKAMISHQVDCLISTGASNPDRITELCQISGVRSFNLDLPGTLAPSIISDNYGGALSLSRRILTDSQSVRSDMPLMFIGGRINDHNTSERLRGFQAAHQEIGIEIDPRMVITPGYAPQKAHDALLGYLATGAPPPKAIFVTSTITLEGVVKAIKESPQYDGDFPFIGCFDWDPLIEVLDTKIIMMRQDVEGMLNRLFGLMAQPSAPAEVIIVPTSER